MNFYYHSLALQIKEPNRRVWKLNLWLWLSLYLHTGSTLTPHRGQQLPDALCRQPWAHLELQHSCRRAPSLSCSCRSWSRSRNYQWCVLEQLGSICSASESRSKGTSKNRPCFWKVCYESFALGWPFPKEDHWMVGREFHGLRTRLHCFPATCQSPSPGFLSTVHHHHDALRFNGKQLLKMT